MRTSLFVALCFGECLVAPAQTPSAENNRVRIITTGWNAPTTQQFVRDYEFFRALPFSGSVIHARADNHPPDPLSKAHADDDWNRVTFAGTEAALDSISTEQASSSYLVLTANPGNTDWLNDEAWKRVVDHWRIAARLAKRGKLRGLVFDPEPYEKPFAQFDYAAQAGAAENTFAVYAAKARQRGREVMTTIAGEFPDMELVSYFWMSYLVNHHRHRGPSPIDQNDLPREDFDWCLAGHDYGLLPSFLSGLLEASPATLQMIDGCEYGYWLTEPQQFAKLAHEVRVRGRMVVDSDVREKYDQQIRVGFPVFVDIVEPTIIPEWTISPEVTDRLEVFRRQLTMATQAGDGLVWLYSEHGRWWPVPTDTELWHNKDVYPLWSERIPGCVDAIREVRDSARPTSLAYTAAQPISFATIGEPVVLENWTAWVQPESPGEVNLLDHLGDVETPGESVASFEICGAKEAAAICTCPVAVGERYRVSTKVRQTGRGVIKMLVRYQDDKDKWLTQSGIDSLAYPDSGNPSQWRAMTTDALVPDGAASLVVLLSVKNQFGVDDSAEFGSLQLFRLEQK